MPTVVRPASREALRCGEALAHDGAAGRRAYIWRRKGCVGAACAPLALLAWRATTGGSSVGLSVCGALYGTVGLRSLLGPRSTLNEAYKAVRLTGYFTATGPWAWAVGLHALAEFSEFPDRTQTPIPKRPDSTLSVILCWGKSKGTLLTTEFCGYFNLFKV